MVNADALTEVLQEVTVSRSRQRNSLNAREIAAIIEAVEDREGEIFSKRETGPPKRWYGVDRINDVVYSDKKKEAVVQQWAIANGIPRDEVNVDKLKKEGRVAYAYSYTVDLDSEQRLSVIHSDSLEAFNLNESDFSDALEVQETGEDEEETE